MTQAKGVLADSGRDRVIKNPLANGYFVAVTLAPGITAEQLETWLRDIQPLVDSLTAKATGKVSAHNALLPVGAQDERVACVAVGLGRQLFGRPELAGQIQVPLSFAHVPASIHPESSAADVLFYVMSLSEERVSDFLEGLWKTRPTIAGVVVDRGYQRIDGTEVFGYADGLRNVAGPDRRPAIFVHEDRDVGEPAGAVDGTYMVHMKIRQHEDSFNALSTEDQDRAMGRNRLGERFDLLGKGIDPRKEGDMTDGVPQSSHVRKAGPRGRHDDVMIFRRGLPYIEAKDSQVCRGLNFASFQSSLDAFDVVFGDWMMSPDFPAPGAGVDKLMDPAGGLVTIEKTGYYFVPAHSDAYPAASLFEAPKKTRSKTGRVAVRKRFTDPSNPSKRFERSGRQMQLVDAASGTQIGTVQVTDSRGHALFENVELGGTYSVRELNPGNFAPSDDGPFTLDSASVVRFITNTALSPETPYAG